MVKTTPIRFSVRALISLPYGVDNAHGVILELPGSVLSQHEQSFSSSGFSLDLAGAIGQDLKGEFRRAGDKLGSTVRDDVSFEIADR